MTEDLPRTGSGKQPGYRERTGIAIFGFFLKTVRKQAHAIGARARTYEGVRDQEIQYFTYSGAWNQTMRLLATLQRGGGSTRTPDFAPYSARSVS